MYINIKKLLFTKDPAIRFSVYFKCKESIWREVWKKYKILGFTEKEANAYLTIKINKEIEARRFKRWINRTEVYILAQNAVKSGAKEVNIKYFAPYDEFVRKEIFKNK